MADTMEYYLTGGKVKIGQKELTLELLRKDSILRALLGFEAGSMASLQSRVNLTVADGAVTIDFNWREKRKLAGDPTPLLNELKSRYGKGIGGTLSFQSLYTTFEMTSYSAASLDAEEVTLEIIA